MTFDLEKARAVDIDLLAATDWGELRARYRAALTEIERLQGFETAARDLNNDLIRIAGERDELAARIQELEDAHKRSGVKYAKIINELRSSVYAKIPSLQKQWDDVLAEGKIGPDARPKCDHAWQAAIEERGYQTCLKCGECRNIEDIPRTAPAWQITDEREEALHVMGNMKTLIVCPHCKTPIEFTDIPKYTAVLRAMLEAGL